MRRNLSFRLSALLQLILRLCIYIADSVCGSLFEAGLVLECGCAAATPPPSSTLPLPPSSPSRPLGLQLTHPIRCHPISTNFISIFTHLLRQNGEEVCRQTIYSSVSGRHGKAKPPALGGRGDDTAADLLPQCSHGGQVLSPLPLLIYSHIEPRNHIFI